LNLREIYRDKRVVITGHSGFKGSWLSFILTWFGADVYGFSIDEPSDLKHAYHALKIADIVDDKSTIIGDVREDDYKEFLSETEPDFIFHLAAQALVKESLESPGETIETNVIGILNLLEFLRNEKKNIPTVLVTSDKCYKNVNSRNPYVESDELGGDDPYSASKAAAEIIFFSYFQCFFKGLHKPVATVRAGNVIGGGDWSENRLVPDCVTQMLDSKKIFLRMPHATRPWTLVHDVLNGYLQLGAALKVSPNLFSGSWNFASGEEKSVEEVARVLLSCFESHFGTIELSIANNTFKEHAQLQIDASKARSVLGWECKDSLNNGLVSTANWYIKQDLGFDMNEYSRLFIEEFFSA
jgi:CDP-glucose 4,6-dehydratase